MISYIGGKSYLASWIISQFPLNYQKMSYVEVFGGGGWVLFKKEQSNLETYNDLNSNLVALFRTIRDNYKEFEHRAQWSLHSREMYKEAKEKLNQDKFLSDVEKGLFFALNKIQTFSGGNSNSWGACVTAEKIVSGRWLPFLKRLEYVNARLKRVQIECLDFEKLIKKYDGKNTLFYLDPPYDGLEHYYNIQGVNFSPVDHERLAKLLRKIKGKFVLSYYDTDKIRSLYEGFRWERKEVIKHSCDVSRKSKLKFKPKSTEILIMNY